MADTAVLLTGGMLRSAFAKTAHGLVRGPCRYRLLGVVDAEVAGHDAGVLLDGTPRGIPVRATLHALLEESAERPQWAVLAIATPGGVLPAPLRKSVLNAIDAGLGIVNGLHRLLADDAEIAGAAQARGVALVDIRAPKRRDELRFWSGAIRRVGAPRIAVLGTDCALGKRTTCHLLAAALAARGLRAETVYTGQTGWLQGLRYGFVLDATPNDFVSGELEHAVVRCDAESAPDVILLEGQSALRNPSGPCGAELLLSAEARGVVLQHAPARRWFVDQEELGNAIPPLRSEIELLGHYGARVLGLALNHEGVAENERAALRARLAGETGVPAAWALLEPLDDIAGAVGAHIAAEREHRGPSR